DDLHALRETVLDLGEPLFDRVDYRERVLAVAHDDDAARRFAFAVELREAASNVGTDAHLADVADANRRAALDVRDRRVPDLVRRLDVAATANDLFVPRDLEHAAADFLIRLAHGAHDVVHADAEGEELVRVDVDLVLLHVAADACDLRDAGHARER